MCSCIVASCGSLTKRRPHHRVPADFLRRSLVCSRVGLMGNGSGARLAGELFKTKAAIDMLHVPFKGLSPMLTELLADRIDLSIAPLPGLIGRQIEAGNVRALGVAS